MGKPFPSIHTGANRRAYAEANAIANARAAAAAFATADPAAYAECYPGAAVPVLGAALVLTAGCVAPARGASLALASAPLQRAGRISYSWYLWHFPLLTIGAALAPRPLSAGQRLGLIVASGVLKA